MKNASITPCMIGALTFFATEIVSLCTCTPRPIVKSRVENARPVTDLAVLLCLLGPVFVVGLF